MSVLVFVFVASPGTAAAIGLCEQTTHEARVLGYSARKKQVAVHMIDETCKEGPSGEVRLTEAVIQIVDSTGRPAITFRLPTAQAAYARYARLGGFRPIRPNVRSANGRCTVSFPNHVGYGALVVVSGKMRLRSANLGDAGFKTISLTSYWLKEAKLLVLHSGVTTNAGHYAEHKTSGVTYWRARRHNLSRCF